MLKSRMADAMEYIDEELIMEAAFCRPKRKCTATVKKWIAAAACFCLILGMGGLLFIEKIVEPDQEGAPFEMIVEWNGKLYSIVKDSNQDAFEDYCLEEEITPDCIGEKLGTQEIEVPDPNDETGTVTESVTLYRYAETPVTEFDWYPRIIVKDSQGNWYHALIASCFDADIQTPEEVFAVYGLHAPEDIQAIKHCKENGKKQITDKAFIHAFYQGLMNNDWGDNDFLQERVYQNTGMAEEEIGELYTKYADDSVFLILELKNGQCLEVQFSTHPYVEVFHDLYIQVEEEWLSLVSVFR